MNRVATATIPVTPAGGLAAGIKQHPIYTTAGTIYNPNASQPLQPPLRRGRALKWASLAALDLSQLALYSQNYLRDQDLHHQQHHPNHNHHQHHHNHHHHHHHARVEGPQQFAYELKTTPPAYQPLRQNLERAVQPQTEPFSELAPAPPPSPPLGLVLRTVSPPFDSSTQPGMHGPLAVRHDVTSHSELPKAEDDTVHNSLDQLTVKALINLMKYPNPNREQARRRWEAAKGAQSLPTPGATARSLSTTNASAPSTATSNGLPSEVGPRHLRLDRFASYNSADSPAVIEKNNDPSYPLAQNPSSAIGPGGAPAPLTAGPPGQRRYQPTMHTMAKNSANTPVMNHLHNMSSRLGMPPPFSSAHGQSFDVSNDASSVISEGSASILGSEPDDPFEPSSYWGIIAPPARQHRSYGSNIVANLEAQAHFDEVTASMAARRNGANQSAAVAVGVTVESDNSGIYNASDQQQKRANGRWDGLSDRLQMARSMLDDPVKLPLWGASIGELAKPLLMIAAKTLEDYLGSEAWRVGKAEQQRQDEEQRQRQQPKQQHEVE